MSCLIPFHGNMTSWTGASRMCQNEGGHLWSINSHEQWRELQMLVKVHALNSTVFANLVFQLFQRELTFIGLKDDEVISNVFTNIYANYRQYGIGVLRVGHGGLASPPPSLKLVV